MGGMIKLPLELHYMIPELKVDSRGNVKYKGDFVWKRVIEAEEGLKLDYVNRDKLDLHRENLRFVSAGHKSFNRPLRKGTVYPGVAFTKDNRVTAGITYEEITHRKEFKSVIDAIAWRRTLEREFFGECWMDWENKCSPLVRLMVAESDYPWGK